MTSPSTLPSQECCGGRGCSRHPPDKTQRPAPRPHQNTRSEINAGQYLPEQTIRQAPFPAWDAKSHDIRSLYDQREWNLSANMCSYQPYPVNYSTPTVPKVTYIPATQTQVPFYHGERPNSPLSQNVTVQ